MKEKYTVAVIGCGSRGCEAYPPAMLELRRYEIAALCDINPVKLAKYGERYGVSEENRFTDEKEFFAKRRTDVIIISTLDRDHTRMCLKAMELGYDILLEKPITDSREECESILEAAKKYSGKIMVCHVLRYAPAFVKADEILKSGIIGRLISIEATERVGHFHVAHSYVRGNWRRREETAPMILAKCCHDLDLLQHYAGSACDTISSVGDLAYFKKENQPADAADRCTQCTRIDTCPYSAKRIYIDQWKKAGCPDYMWPVSIITTAFPLTEKAIADAIEQGPYGRCVFACDNDVVDHQQNVMKFENGVTATLNMIGFTDGGGRVMTFYGTDGQLTLDEDRGVISLRPFYGERTDISISDLEVNGSDHGGGDFCTVRHFTEMLDGHVDARTTIDKSIESHLMAIAAEESRLAGGAAVKVHA